MMGQEYARLNFWARLRGSSRLNLQCGARHSLRGELELNMACAEVMELFGHDVTGQFGAIALAAQVGEVKVAQVGRNDLRDGFGGVFV